MDETEETLTPEEREQQEETGETGEEAHRAGEFEELRDMIRNLQTAVADLATAIKEGFAEAAAMSVENGEVITDPDDGETVVIDDDDDIPAIDDLDLSI